MSVLVIHWTGDSVFSSPSAPSSHDACLYWSSPCLAKLGATSPHTIKLEEIEERFVKITKSTHPSTQWKTLTKNIEYWSFFKIHIRINFSPQYNVYSFFLNF